MSHNMRRFVPGMTGDIGGVQWRTVLGKKHPNDVRLDIKAPAWVPVSMGVGFLFADIFYENEQILYPPAKGYQGGERYINFVRGAAFLGWEAAMAQLEDERERRRAA